MVEKELKPLKMERARFKTEIKQATPNELGLDSVVFTISTNSGSKFGSLMKIASGGELSRFLLALKVCLTHDQKGVSLVFDEIDRGIGGATADAVGRRLLKLAKKDAQVLVVTHSPQVASKAHKHWKIEKVIKNDEMTSQIIELNDESRVNEIASLISGAKITETAKKVASDLLRN